MEEKTESSSKWGDSGGWGRSISGGWGDSVEYYNRNAVEATTTTSLPYVSVSNQSPVSPMHLKSDYKQVAQIHEDGTLPLEETELPMIKSYGGRYKR